MADLKARPEAFAIVGFVLSLSAPSGNAMP